MLNSTAATPMELSCPFPLNGDTHVILCCVEGDETTYAWHQRSVFQPIQIDRCWQCSECDAVFEQHYPRCPACNNKDTVHDATDTFCGKHAYHFLMDGLHAQLAFPGKPLVDHVLGRTVTFVDPQCSWTGTVEQWMNQHQAECHYATVQCEYMDVGCTGQFPRVCADSHRDEFAPLHLQLAVQSSRKRATIIRKLKRRCTRAEEKIKLEEE